MATSTGKPVDRAVPVMRRAKHNDAAKVASTRATVNAMQGSPLWNTTPSVQAVATAWTAAADALESNAKALADARAKLATLMANQRALRRGWNDALRHVAANIAVVAEGSADHVQSFGFDVRTANVTGALPAPSGLTTALGKAVGEALVSWARGSAKNGFLVQRATDVANPATFSAPVACTRVRTTLKGMVSGSSEHVRVAAIDPTSESGQSPWSDWLGVTAR